jgi:hypothetical protein
MPTDRREIFFADAKNGGLYWRFAVKDDEWRRRYVTLMYEVTGSKQ